MPIRYIKIWILLISILILAFSSVASAVENIQYFYDDNGRIERVLNVDTGEASDYTYDEVGNILTVVLTTLSTDPPEISAISPGYVFPGATSVPIIIDGNYLDSVNNLYADVAGVTFSNLNATITQITADMSVPSSAPHGTMNISVSPLSGTASAPVELMGLDISSSMTTAGPSETHQYTVTLSANAPEDIVVEISVLLDASQTIVTAPQTVTILQGTNNVSFDVDTVAVGTSVVKLGYGGTNISIFVTDPMTGEVGPVIQPEISLTLVDNINGDGPYVSNPLSFQLLKNINEDGPHVSRPLSFDLQ